MEDERTCTMCGCILQEHEQTEIDEEWLCDECAEQHTTICDHCGETIWRNDSICDDRTTLCSCCFEDHYRRCEGCGRILHNHPFRGHAELDFALAHNGVLYNDELLRSQLRLPDTQIETDSYIAILLIESQHELTFDSLRYTAESVRGYFTFTVLDKTNSLWFVKGESPLYLIHFPALGLYVYASTKEIMAAAFKQIPAQFPKYEVINLKESCSTSHRTERSSAAATLCRMIILYILAGGMDSAAASITGIKQFRPAAPTIPIILS